MITLIIKRDGTIEPFDKEKLNISLNQILVACNPKKYLEDVSLVYIISGKIKKEFNSREMVQSSEIQEAVERLLNKYDSSAVKYCVCYNNNLVNSYVPVNCVEGIELFKSNNIKPTVGLNQEFNKKLNSKKINAWLKKCSDDVSINNGSYTMSINERCTLFKYLYNGYIVLDRIKYNKCIINLFQLFESSGRFNKELYIEVLKYSARFIVRKVRLDKTLATWDNKSKVYLHINGYQDFCNLLELTDDEKGSWQKQCDGIFSTELFTYANKLNLKNLEYIIKED